MAYEALDSLLESITRILKQSHHPDINQEIISIHDEAVALQLQLHLQNNGEIFEERRITESARTTKKIIEYLFSEDNGWMEPNKEKFYQLGEAVDDFKSTAFPELHVVKRKRRRRRILASVSSFRGTTTTSKDVLVGFNGDLNDIKYHIIDYHPSHLQVLSIVGIGGIGKTTLAKLVYNDDWIRRSFGIRAWVTVSHNYNIGTILCNLMASLEKCIPLEKDGRREIPVESSIRLYLQYARFLVVLDDVCSKKAWDDLKMIFPDTDSGSRIILTTRLHDVDSSGPVHTMRLLDARHSWDLLEKKVFGDGSCPPELEDFGKRIVRNCGGLPLSIVIEAGILSKLPKTQDVWNQIATNYVNLETRISLSYSHLPSYMRACFLYIGGFPEDYEICALELVKLWIGEGFLESSTEFITLEEEGANVLENLVERNLVLVGRRKFGGEIKSCSLHDMVRNFCIRQAEREKFFLSVMDYLPSPILRKHFLPRLLKNYGRISATWHDLDLKDFMNSALTRSIICIPQRGYRCVSSLHKFSSLKVFHVLYGNENWAWKPSCVFNQIHLTHLASNIPTNIVPPAISKLQNLQTLIIYRAQVVLPEEIWMLRKLRHLMAFSFHSLPHPHEATLPLENLQTMSRVMNFACTEKMMEMIPNVKKLGICYFELDGVRHLYNLKHASQLEKLKLEGSEQISLWELGLSYNGPCPNSFFPPSLKKLTLSGLMLPWKDMTIIGSLPNLAVLKLRNCTCGKYWKTNEGEFGELRCLLIDGSDLKYWITDGDTFQRLESLILLNCPNSLEIPRKVRGIPSLKVIEIDASRGCFRPRQSNPLLTNSLIKIQMAEKSW